MKKILLIILIIFAYSCAHCPEIENVALNGGPLTRAGDRVRWHELSFPITIYPNTSIPFVLIKTKKAADFINKSVGYTVFVVNDSISESEDLEAVLQTMSDVITIDREELGKSRSGGDIMGMANEFLFYKSSPRYTRAVRILLDNDLEYFSMVRTITHELGHALGLAHDPNDKRSIMFNNIIEDITFFQYLMPDDADYIRTMMKKTSWST